MLRLTFSFLFFIIVFNTTGQSINAASIYIEKYKNDAIREMLESGVPASITLSQGILESGNGSSELAVNANNHFGIKCHQDWLGETFILDDDTKNECFRKYTCVFESYRDHSLFLKTRTRYNKLFLLNITDYKGWANGLKDAGYATNPKYADMLISIIERNKLYQYDSVYLKYNTDSLLKAQELFAKIESKQGEAVNSRKTYKNNNVLFIIVKANDDIDKICKDLDIRPWQIYKYNDLPKGSKIEQGQIIYIKPKRNKNAQEFHVVKNNETMQIISQKYAIKLRKLYIKNNLPFGSEPTKGQKIYLNKRQRIN
ncbi:MAG: glucosaminidase domain-containing protein [Bacteroidota bacterium]